MSSISSSSFEMPPPPPRPPISLSAEYYRPISELPYPELKPADKRIGGAAKRSLAELSNPHARLELAASSTEDLAAKALEQMFARNRLALQERDKYLAFVRDFCCNSSPSEKDKIEMARLFAAHPARNLLLFMSKAELIKLVNQSASYITKFDLRGMRLLEAEAMEIVSLCPELVKFDLG